MIGVANRAVTLTMGLAWLALGYAHVDTEATWITFASGILAGACLVLFATERPRCWTR